MFGVRDDIICCHFCCACVHAISESSLDFRPILMPCGNDGNNDDDDDEYDDDDDVDDINNDDDDDDD